MLRNEIPLLRESDVFVRRLIQAASESRLPRYFLHRYVNWSYRYDEDFYDREVSNFLQDPDAYIAGCCGLRPELSDVWRKKLTARQSSVVLMKVLSHRVFAALGSFVNLLIRAKKIGIYRKAYVDDIELVFDRNEAGVVRAVFPFPINLRRQLKYLRSLHRAGLIFKLDGNRYGCADTLHFLVRRDVESLMRLESRAQLRLARAVMALGVSGVQLSDEFDIGSLDFTRYLARYPVRVVNSAHGVGKYFPVHSYREFLILTNKQQCYYRAVRECSYVLRQLNDMSMTQQPDLAGIGRGNDKGVRLVVLSQRFSGSSAVVADAESELLDVLRKTFGGTPAVKLFYKPHPNRIDFDGLPGFAWLSTVNEVNDLKGTIFVSFFSTCQIDPAFKGRKILLRAKHIYPEIAFDDSEPILSIPELVEFVRNEVAAGEQGTA